MSIQQRAPRHRRRSSFLVVAGILLAIVIGVVLAGQLRQPRLTAELRGYDLAQQLGCFACHGPDGTGGTPNLGSEEETVPAWDGGNVMMYVESEQEIREWILDGHPARLAQGHDHAPGASHHDDSPDDDPLLHMPAYRGVISTNQLEDLVAYYKVIAAYDRIDPAVRSGYRIARDSGCFGCHGPRGLVGRKNPRSFKGYIPPWRGDDYRELVKSKAELRQWILKGTIDRFERHPLAAFFTDRQIIQMPAYEERLEPGEIDDLVAYIEWLQAPER